MQDYSDLVAHPTGILESIAVRTAVNTLTPPERRGSAPRREYCPRKAATRPADSLYRYRGGTKVGSAFTSALPIPEAIPAQWARTAYGFRDLENQRRRVRFACTRCHRRATDC